jgi:hypothetical protein
MSQRTSGRGSATLAAMSFEQADLERLAAADEIEIETQAPDGPLHRTIIWVVVHEGDVLVRSVKGESGRWFKEAKANSAVAIHAGGRRLPATAVPATDPDSIDRINAALTAKYTGVDGYDSMFEPDALPANYRLEPT